MRTTGLTLIAAAGWVVALGCSAGSDNQLLLLAKATAAKGTRLTNPAGMASLDVSLQDYAPRGSTGCS